MDRKSFFWGVLMTTVLGVFVLLFALGSTSNPLEINEQSETSGITIMPTYHIVQYRPGVGIIYEADVTNTITNEGLDMICHKMAFAGTISVGNVTYIGLSNDSTAGVVTDTNLSAGQNTEGYGGEHLLGGLARTYGEVTFPDDESIHPGNWSVSYKWTAIESYRVWKFGVFNGTLVWDGSDEHTMFSVGNFSATENVSMQSNDELTVNVTYVVS